MLPPSPTGNLESHWVAVRSWERWVIWKDILFKNHRPCRLIILPVTDTILGAGFKYFFIFTPTWSNLTNIFQMGWNHQLEYLPRDYNDYIQGHSPGNGPHIPLQPAMIFWEIPPDRRGRHISKVVPCFGLISGLSRTKLANTASAQKQIRDESWPLNFNQNSLECCIALVLKTSTLQRFKETPQKTP